MSWPLVKLGDVCIINPRLPKDTDESQNVSFLTMSAVSESAKIVHQETRVLSDTKKGFTYFERNDVLLAKITPCFENGKAVHTSQLENQIGYGSTEFHVLRPLEELADSKYIFYLVWNDIFRFYGRHTMKGAAGQKRVSADFLKQLKIPLPPLADQQKIAAILDAADSLRQKNQQLIEHYSALSQSLFLEMFGDPVTNPKGWTFTELNSLVSKLGDGLHGTPTYDPEGEYYFINGNNFQNGTIVINSSTKKVSKAEFQKHRKELETSTMFVSINGTIGNVAFFHNEKIILGKSACYFNVMEQRINKVFLYALIDSPYFIRYALSAATGSTIKNVSLKTMRSFPVPLPPLKLQNQFAQHIEAIELQKQQAQASLEKSEALFNSLLQRAFKGELTA